jgi:predicted N-acetyltransferase YhbS
MPHKNERVELEMKILKYRQMAHLAVSDDLTKQRIRALITELEQKLREIDE